MKQEINIKMNICFLEEEPKPVSKLKQRLFKLTRPIAGFIDSFNVCKALEIDKRREIIRAMNKRDFIESVSEALFDEILSQGVPKNIELCRLMCLQKAENIFYDKKIKNGFDDLNIMK